MTEQAHDPSWTLPDGRIVHRARLLALWHSLGNVAIPVRAGAIVHLDIWLSHGRFQLDELASMVDWLQGRAENGREPPCETLAQPPLGHAPTNRAGGRPRAAFDVEMAVALYKKGMGVERIAARLSAGGHFVSPTTVWRRLRELADRGRARTRCGGLKKGPLGRKNRRLFAPGRGLIPPWTDRDRPYAWLLKGTLRCTGAMGERPMRIIARGLL